MATLTPTLTLTSSNAMSDNLSITFTDSLTVTDPVEMAKVTATTSNTPVLVDSGDSDTYYVYLKNTDGTNYVDVKDGGGDEFIKLHPGEFCFFTLAPSTGILLDANTDSCIVEYGIFKKG
tara:strand:+ start:370 stop:729 length:360 start_codon:yes stop_codon:yes gene_type:complete